MKNNIEENDWVTLIYIGETIEIMDITYTKGTVSGLPRVVWEGVKDVMKNWEEIKQG